ncbi:NUDIX domain-containing protein [Thermincola potens]|uniref:NUDIX hydrolase n=1 Tax=Thermincola potens (strain JR) TaxID=635013 RepID=D5XEX4_THEPJ|nr:NUDIX hydrolase [Thermincola potens]ADG82195.1 NUDIX hydrolase [Thermincola potens JR]
MREKLLHSDIKFKGKVLEFRLDTVELVNGKTATRELVIHPGAVSIVALDGEEIIMVKQYRHPVGEILWEIPAGKLDPGEEPLHCAQRELYEETGCKAMDWKHLNTFYTTPGFSNEIMHLYLATGLVQEEQSLDEDEFLSVEKVSWQEAMSMIARGEIKDAKSIVGICLAYAVKTGRTAQS